MSSAQRLLQNYTNYVKLPWQTNLSASESVWFAVYPPEKERSISARISDFEIETKNIGKHWCGIDLTNSFTTWLDREDEDERGSMFSHPEDLEFFAKEDFAEYLAELIQDHIENASDPDQTVFALHGIMALYDFIEISELIEHLGNNMKGRLLIFFPGSKDENTYSFMNARRGWDYLAVCIDSSQDQFA